MDQASFLALRATGLGQVAQWVWVYERAADVDGLRRFHRNLGDGLLGRRIERSPLPFGRHRWVSAPDSSDIDIAERPRPRAELSDWADERAQLPIDPEWGPGWRLSVVPFTDGTSAVSLVASHCLVDGLAGGLAIADAVKGEKRDLGCPQPGARPRLRALVTDAGQAVRGLPEVATALGAMVKLARRSRSGIAGLGESRPIATREGGDDPGGQGVVILPAITMYIDLGDWDARAQALGGTSNALFNGFAAKLGERLGRCRADDGAVSLRFVASDRAAEDTRANALSFAEMTVDPTRVTTDLSAVRDGIRQALRTLSDTPDETLEVLPLTPFTPKVAVRRMADIAFAEFSVGCSNLRDVDPATVRPDGTDADLFFARGVTQHITRPILERIEGQVTLASGCFAGKVFITVIAYQLDRKNSKADLRELAAQTLAEFGMTGVID